MKAVISVGGDSEVLGVSGSVGGSTLFWYEWRINKATRFKGGSQYKALYDIKSYFWHLHRYYNWSAKILSPYYFVSFFFNIFGLSIVIKFI